MRPATLLLPALVSTFAPGATGQQQAPPATRGEFIEGLVLDVLGDPIPAVEVRAERAGAASVRSHGDGDGRFRLRLPEGSAELSFHRRGNTVARRTVRPATRSPVLCVVLEDAADLRGRVLDPDGAPVAGARVLATAMGFRTDTTTAADGSYHLTALPLRKLNLFALGAAGRAEQRLGLRADGRADLTLGGTAGRALVLVAGLPPDPNRTPHLRVFGPDPMAALDGGRTALRADATAELRLQTSCLASLEAPGYRTEPDTLWLRPGSNQQVNARPTDLPAITGKLRWLGGGPAIGLQVVLRDRSGQVLATAITGELGSFQALAKLPRNLLEAAGAHVGIRLGAGAMIADGERTFRDGCCWVPCDPTQPISLQLEPAATLRQRLVDGRGEALAFAEVTVVDRQHGADHRPLLSAWADGDGRLDLDLPTGALRLLAVSPRGGVLTAEWQANAGSEGPVWEPVRCGDVEGVLSDAAGEGVPGIEILVASVALQVGGNDAAVRQSAVVRTDRGGRFRCRGLPIGDWTLATLGDEVRANGVFAAQEGVLARVGLRVGE
ncbi:MAG: carboxypeptidase-like regulatory domain-containing protein [Planctomycetes bacterium]|jgi:hypothetical protein|nr:carboxypeptidase-like regulatory domain-containing protein [Planctomycetota bacterium]